MINIQKKIEVKVKKAKISQWMMSLGFALFIGLANMAMLHGMEPEQPEDKLMKYFNKLPQDVQTYIKQLQFKDAIMFLGLQDMPLLHTLKGHTDNIVSITVAGDKVVTGSSDKTAKIWSINTGKLLHTLEAYTDIVDPVEVYKDIVDSVAVVGDKVVTWSRDNTVKLWNIETGQLLYTRSDIRSVAVVGDKAVIRLVGRRENPITYCLVLILNINTGELLSEAYDSPNGVRCVVAGDKVITGVVDGTVKIYDLETGGLWHTLEGCRWNNNIELVVVAGDKMVWSEHEIAKIWDTNTGQLLHTLQGHIGWIKSVAVAGDKVVTTSFDKTAKIWDINTGQLLHTLKGHTGIVDPVAVAGGKVVTGSTDNTAKIWDINTGQLLHTLQGHSGPIKSVEVAGDKVVTRSDDKTLKTWSIYTGQLWHTFKGSTEAIALVRIAGDKVVTGSEDKTAKIWSLSINPQGKPEDNPLVWIMQNATIPQLDFIKRAYGATIAKQDLIIAMPIKLGKVQKGDSSEQIDGNIYFSFPETVRAYLRNCLNIRR